MNIKTSTKKEYRRPWRNQFSPGAKYASKAKNETIRETKPKFEHGNNARLDLEIYQLALLKDSIIDRMIAIESKGGDYYRRFTKDELDYLSKLTEIRSKIEQAEERYV